MNKNRKKSQKPKKPESKNKKNKNNKIKKILKFQKIIFQLYIRISHCYIKENKIQNNFKTSLKILSFIQENRIKNKMLKRIFKIKILYMSQHMFDITVET